MPKNVRETLSAEARAEVEIMQETDRLFQELESGETNEDRYEELVYEIRRALERYNQLFHEKDGAGELLQGYYDRLKKALERTAA